MIVTKDCYTITDLILQTASQNETELVWIFLSRTADLNEKEDQTKKEGPYKSFHFL